MNKPTKTPKIPKYSRHSSSGQARVVVNGKYIYLGQAALTRSTLRRHPASANDRINDNKFAAAAFQQPNRLLASEKLSLQFN